MKKMLFLKDFMNEVGAMDLWYKGYNFTWENCREGVAKIMGRIDRAVANLEWITFFPLTVVEHIRTKNSDHSLILVHTAVVEKKA